MTADPKAEEPSSPACLAHEADDAYMGFASAAEIAVFLDELGKADLGRDAAMADRLRKMLPRIRDDALHRRLSALLPNK
jgi:hypothetical protein